MSQTAPHLFRHWPTGLTAIGLILLGSTINNFPSLSEKVTVGMDFDCNLAAAASSSLSSSSSLMSSQFAPRKNHSDHTSNATFSSFQAQAVTLFLSTVLPLLPLALNSKTNWNSDKTEAVISHLIGQSATFGTTEFIRHFAIVPDPTFFERCNLSLNDCLAKSTQVLRLDKLCPTASFSLKNNQSIVAAAASAASNSLNRSQRSFAVSSSSSLSSSLPPVNLQASLPNDLSNIHAALHSMPNPTMAIVGSSFVVFVANLFFWTRHNKSGKNSSSAHSLVKMTMIVVFLMFVSFALLYRYKQHQQSLTDIVVSFFYGMVVQLLMTLLFQVKKRSSYDLLIQQQQQQQQQQLDQQQQQEMLLITSSPVAFATK
jgi:RsiW-degrading membrane proteinase PrsW (M82 family)